MAPQVLLPLPRVRPPDRLPMNAYSLRARFLVNPLTPRNYASSSISVAIAADEFEAITIRNKGGLAIVDGFSDAQLRHTLEQRNAKMRSLHDTTLIHLQALLIYTFINFELHIAHRILYLVCN